jgi:hypothetical protein
MQEKPDFSREIEKARGVRARALAEDTISISDDEVDAQRARVKVQTRQWLASRYNRQEFGDRMDIQHNVTLDISDTLRDAQARLLHDSDNLQDLEVIENVEEIEVEPSDDLSDAQANEVAKLLGD